MDINYGFFVTAMPDSRPADYYLGCLNGCIFMDFDNTDDGLICMIRISFDGYGCCELGSKAIPMNLLDSNIFRKLIFKGHLMQVDLPNQKEIESIIKTTIAANRDIIWNDALVEYNLL
jgi:hypothetical protein